MAEPDEGESHQARVRLRGERARVELALTAEVGAGLRAAMLERLVRTAPADAAMQHRLIAGVQILDALREALEQAVNDGESVRLYETLLDQALSGQGPRPGGR
jgi:hypothetical protein